MNLDLGFYWRLFLKRLPVMLGIVVICSLVGVVMAMREPTTFRASARLLVEEPQIPGNLVTSTVETSANATIEIIRQRLLTRANLIDIASDFGVIQDGGSAQPDAVVGQMRGATEIRSRGGNGGRPLIVTVAFEARNGEIAANVVNEYVTRIVNANSELRMGSAEDTLEFFEQEVQRLSGELDRQSALITQFQIDNADALPQDQQFRMTRQAQMQERIDNAERERAALIEQRTRLEEIFETTGGVAAAGDVQLTREQRQLAQLERQLADSLLIYSESSPQIAVLRNQIVLLEQRIEADLTSAAVLDGEDGPVSTGRALLDAQLAQINSEIATFDETLARTMPAMERLETAIAQTPGNAITLRGLERDYENIRSQYDRAVARLATASTGERIEVTARGQRISIIEPATVPRSPSSPNRIRTALQGVAVGLGLAGGLFLLLEVLNRSVRRPVEITNALSITPIATIPFMESPRRRYIRRTMRIASFLIILAGIPAALWAVDTYFMPLDQLATRLLRRIGLA